MGVLIERLHKQLELEQEPLARAELLARLACCLARYGQFARADEIIAEVRSYFGESRSGRVTCLLMVAEGVQHSFLQRQPEALDRLKRAQMLAQMGRDAELIGLASAWRAHVEFESSWFDASARSIRAALDSATQEDHPTLSRVAVVLHNAYSLVGDEEARSHWYARGRKNALEDGDEATIDALLHSKTSFGVAHELALRALGEPASRPLDLLSAEVRSAKNLQRLMQVEAHANYVELVQARASILVERSGEALEHLEKVSDAKEFPAQHVNLAALSVAKAFCRARLGSASNGLSEFLFGQDSIESISSLDPDDRLIAAWMLQALAAESPRHNSGASQLLEHARGDYVTFVEQVKTQYAGFRVSPH